ncbi:hypothetical protein VP01_125g9 [Puccinia sorghi]|uniref:Uncharacterized protein n=1 Tax=Puccinia sorghi TaxID=27349 RepID=A0A0L6VP88_9BASI|nr:hypothetical protein VP01_125g9 [Puccinia sorghi]
MTTKTRALCSISTQLSNKPSINKLPDIKKKCPTWPNNLSLPHPKVSTLPQRSNRKSPSSPTENIFHSPRHHPQSDTLNRCRPETSPQNVRLPSCQTVVPKALELRNLQEFYNQFSNYKQIQTAASTTTSPSIIKSTKVKCFKEVKSGHVKISNSIVHKPNNMIRYLMTQLGMQVWCPNLEEDANTLYNSACRIGAIRLVPQSEPDFFL